MGDGSAPTTLYVCDTGNHRVLALDPADMATVRFSIGHEGSADGELREPRAVVVRDELLVVADSGNYRVCVFTLRGTFRRAIGTRPPRPVDRPSFFSRPPSHVALASGGILFVLEHNGSRVHVLSPTTGEPLGMLVPPHNVDRDGEGVLDGLAVDDDALYVLSTSGDCRILSLPRNSAPEEAPLFYCRAPSSGATGPTAGHERPPVPAE